MRFEPPERWERLGALFGSTPLTKQLEVIGDPCVVWDEHEQHWHMVLFVQPGGHAQAVCAPQDLDKPHGWRFLGALSFSNPEALRGGTHKPFIVMNAHAPHEPAHVGGRFQLVSVGMSDGQKYLQAASSESLAGPWEVEEDPLLLPGAVGDFDGLHLDAVSAFHFPERQATLYYYMGYPRASQTHLSSPFGSALGAAVRRDGEKAAVKLGVVLAPTAEPNHWASGWVGGLQLLPGGTRRWIGLVNASPTAPRREDSSLWAEEPPPSLGGFVYTDAEWPVTGWQWFSEPIERIEDLPQSALKRGEGVNLWRHHLFMPTENHALLLYNSGPYGHERLFARQARTTATLHQNANDR
jgi:hypothetical protein